MCCFFACVRRGRARVGAGRSNLHRSLEFAVEHKRSLWPQVGHVKLTTHADSGRKFNGAGVAQLARAYACQA